MMSLAWIGGELVTRRLKNIALDGCVFPSRAGLIQTQSQEFDPL